MGRPLHVRVAEALGYEGLYEAHGVWWYAHPQLRIDTACYEYTHMAVPGVERIRPQACSVPRFDTDWSETGPLIEKYGMGVDKHPVGNWTAFREPDCAAGNTPLIAVCNLILQAGRL